MGTPPPTPPAADPPAGPQHPQYADGSPILIGHYVRVLSDTATEVDYRGVVVEIHHVGHKNETWIHTDTGRSRIFHAHELEQIRPEPPPAPRITRTRKGTWRYQCSLCPDARATGFPRHYEAAQAYLTHIEKRGHQQHLATWLQDHADG